MKAILRLPAERVRSNRRTSLRWDLSVSCTLRWRDHSFKGRILDVSDEGAFIESAQAFPVGERITLSVNLEGTNEEMTARVVHSRHYSRMFADFNGFGVHFDQAAPHLVGKLKHRYRLTEQATLEEWNKSVVPSRGRLDRILDVNKEIWLVLSLLLVSAVANLLLSSNQMVLGFYTLPTVFSAYFFGRRHATMTASASFFLVVLMTHSGAFPIESLFVPNGPWFQVLVWGGTLIVTGYAMGTLYERLQNYIDELRQTYHGVLLILHQFISKDKYTQHHSYRVSVYATKIASRMGLDEESIEDIRVAALLHDIGKLDISREILYKASRLSEREFEELKGHVERGISLLEPVGGSLRRVLPIVLAHHDKFDGSGYHPVRGDEIPLAARIIAVADVYDAVTTDRPYRKAMSPLDAREMIVNAAGSDFDPRVVQALVNAFRSGELEIPDFLV